MRQGFVYLVAVMDWFSRYVLSWSLTMELDFCVEALQRALRRGRPEIFNSDQGSPFTSEKFTGELPAREIAISRDGRGRCRGQHLYRAAVAVAQIRRGVPEGVRLGEGSVDGHRTLPPLLQSRTFASESELPDPGGALPEPGRNALKGRRGMARSGFPHEAASNRKSNPSNGSR